MSAGVQRAAQLVSEAVEARLVPGAALGVRRRGEAAQVWVWGLAQKEDAPHLPQPELQPRALERAHYFDLASLTKVLFTVPAVLRMVEEGRADLHDPLARHLPELGWMQQQGGGLPDRTLYQLLTHTAGLPAWSPLYTLSTDPALLRARLLQEPWPLEPAGGEPLYSDLGYLLLGLVLERHNGPIRAQPLPQGLHWTPPPHLSVATERCPWRGRVLLGEPHDENAYAFAGAGHAGLFGTVDGVLERLHGWLEPRAGDAFALSPAALRALRQPSSASRALGWERPHVPSGAGGFSGGSLCGPHALGHTGFTGTGAWIDFGEGGQGGLVWTLLTNSVHPTRVGRPNLQHLRRAVGNALAAGERA